MAQEINNFFADVGSNLASNIGSPTSTMLENFISNMQVYPLVMEFAELTDYDIAILVRHLRPSTSCGVDGLNARLIKAAGSSIFPILKYIFNLWLSTQQFPDDWKIGCTKRVTHLILPIIILYQFYQH